MRHPILGHIDWAERAYPIVRVLPDRLKAWLAERLAALLKSRTRSSAHPERVTLFLTDRCNLRCRHCFVSAPDRPETVEASAPELTSGHWEQFFQRSAGRISQLLITGGEPTLRPDLPEILRLAVQVGRVATINLFSNGLAPQKLKRALDQLLDGPAVSLNFQVSIDGPEAFHDANRGVAGSHAQARATLELLLDLRSRHPGRINRVVACTAISRRNLELLPETIALVQRLGALHAFTFVRSSERGVFNLSDQALLSGFSPPDFGDFLGREDMDKALALVDERLWRQAPNNLFYATNRVILSGIAQSLRQGRPVAAPCLSGVGDIIILPDGGVARCEMLRPFGALPEHGMDLERLLQSEAAREHFRRTSSCWCVHDCAVGLSIMYHPKLLRELFSRSKARAQAPGA